MIYYYINAFESHVIQGCIKRMFRESYMIHGTFNVLIFKNEEACLSRRKHKNLIFKK